jgi:Cft2 family RNA processing exonuclease
MKCGNVWIADFFFHFERGSDPSFHWRFTLFSMLDDWISKNVHIQVKIYRPIFVIKRKLTIEIFHRYRFNSQVESWLDEETRYSCQKEFLSFFNKLTKITQQNSMRKALIISEMYQSHSVELFLSSLSHETKNWKLFFPPMSSKMKNRCWLRFQQWKCESEVNIIY